MLKKTMASKDIKEDLYPLWCTYIRRVHRPNNFNLKKGLKSQNAQNDGQRGILSMASKDITASTFKHGNIQLPKHCLKVVQKDHRSYIQFFKGQKYLILYHIVVISVL